MRIKVWAYPGVETPVTPDEPGAGQPDVLDAGDAVEGLGIDRLRRVRRVRRVDSVFFCDGSLTD
jgi:hypothetical protein